MKLSEAFEPGHRKTTLTLIALIGSILLEKYGGGISGDLKEIILSIFAIFTGGNVLSKGIQAAKEIKVQKQVVSEVVTDLVQEAQADPVQYASQELVQKIIDHVNQLDSVAGQKLKELGDSIEATNTNVKDVSDRLDTQVKNLGQVLQIINGMRNGNQPTT